MALTSVARFLRYQAPAILWALLLFAASSIPSEEFPRLSIFSQDKLLHISAYFGFGLVLYRAIMYQQRFLWLKQHAKLAVIVCAALYAVSDEFHQSFVPGRSMDHWDLVADVLGATILVLAVTVYQRLRRARPLSSTR